jgi:hypothetical protein
MTQFAKDFEDFDPKTVISINVCGYVTGLEVKKDQWCASDSLAALRVKVPLELNMNDNTKT